MVKENATILNISKDASHTQLIIVAPHANTVKYIINIDYQLKYGLCLYSPNLQGLDCCSQFDNSSICIGCSKGLFLNPSTNLCEDKKI